MFNTILNSSFVTNHFSEETKTTILNETSTRYKKTVWRSTFLLIQHSKHSAMLSKIHYYKLLFRQFCPLGFNTSLYDVTSVSEGFPRLSYNYMCLCSRWQTSTAHDTPFLVSSSETPAFSVLYAAETRPIGLLTSLMAGP